MGIKRAILSLGGVERFRRLGINDNRSEVIDQRLISSGIAQIENVCLWKERVRRSVHLTLGKEAYIQCTFPKPLGSPG